MSTQRGSQRWRCRTVTADEEIKDFVGTKLKSLRNKAVFHFDPTFIPSSLQGDEDGWIIFAQGRGSKAGESYYDLADRSALNAVVGKYDSMEEFGERMKDMVKSLTSIKAAFLDATEAVIEEALNGTEWKVRYVDRSGRITRT